MFTRRELLTRGTTLLLFVPVVGPIVGSMVGCSSGSDSPSCDGIDSTSTMDATQHTHTVCVPTSDLTNPPAAGVIYTTSSDSMHTHKVMLTQANLTAINTGQAVPVTSSSDNDPINNMIHSHVFSIRKLAFE
jgi:hypothetical protein